MDKNAIRFSFITLVLALAMVLFGVRLATAQEEDERDGYFCVQSEDQHPFGERLSERYEMDYETLQAWFCEGFGWGQVMLALQTSKITGEDPQDLLEARRSGAGWGEIWQELKLIGRPEHAGPPNDENGDGRPDFAGPPPWVTGESPSGNPGGPPPWVPGGPPPWVSGGRP